MTLFVKKFKTIFGAQDKTGTCLLWQKNIGIASEIILKILSDEIRSRSTNIPLFRLNFSNISTTGIILRGQFSVHSMTVQGVHFIRSQCIIWDVHFFCSQRIYKYVYTVHIGTNVCITTLVQLYLLCDQYWQFLHKVHKPTQNLKAIFTLIRQRGGTRTPRWPHLSLSPSLYRVWGHTFYQSYEILAIDQVPNFDIAWAWRSDLNIEQVTFIAIFALLTTTIQ